MSSPRVLLLVDHGSRLPEAKVHLERTARRCAERLRGWSVRVAHLELVSPSIGEALDLCAKEGAREIVVHPLFLAPGRHGAGDVPAQVRSAAERHPGLQVRLTPSLGESPELAEWILRAAGIRS